MRKILITILSIAILTSPFLVFAAYDGLVKCDGVVLPGEKDKTRCNIVALVDQIKFLIDWGIKMLMVLLVGVFAYAGAMYMYAGFVGKAQEAEKAKGYLENIAWGVLIILFAWLIVRTILNYLVKPEFGLDLLGK